MRNILIIYPHWPPSNLAGVHRARLISNFLPEFDWQPIVLTVKPEYYEEILDYDFCKTVSPKITVVAVDAKPVSKPRIIGDIGLRAFGALKRKAMELIKNQKISFIWIPIPSFYTAILGRQLYNKTGIPYGIDYIDPWVRDISNRKNIRSILSLITAKILEPYAVKMASLISGVSTAYYEPMLQRNFKKKQILNVGMPYGFDSNDHNIDIEINEYPWDKITNCKPIVYAGAFLPKSDKFIDKLFNIIRKLIEENLWNPYYHIFFIGTGNYSHKSITAFAVQHNISEYVHEIRERFPFLHILNFLSKSFGVFIAGSTEKHYTASKTFQALLCKQKILAMMHQESSASQILSECKADEYLIKYSEQISEKMFDELIREKLLNFLNPNSQWNPDLKVLEKYSARESTRALVEKLNMIVR